MQLNDNAFFYEIKLDVKSHIKSFFFRDGRTKMDFDLFGDLFVFDTTFNINKWGMLITLFVGINNNSKNIVFRVGFVPKDDNKSMIWLFNTFRKSMENKYPEYFLTDQLAAIAFGLHAVYPESKHRLYSWHIEQNAKTHLKKYWGKKGFPRAFNYLIKYTITMAKFQQF